MNHPIPLPAPVKAQPRPVPRCCRCDVPLEPAELAGGICDYCDWRDQSTLEEQFAFLNSGGPEQDIPW